MIDPFVLLTPVLLLAVIALLRFVGCNEVFGIDETVLAEPVDFDAFSNSSPIVGQTQSWPHPVSGTNRLLVVVVHGSRQARSVLSVNCGVTQLTFLHRVDGGMGTFAWVEMWYLTNPPTGQQTITVTLDASDVANWTASAISFTGVDQMNPLSPAFTATGGDNSPLVDVISSTYYLVLDAVTYDDLGGTALTVVGTGQTQRRSEVVPGEIGFGVSTKPGAAMVTMSWRLSPAPGARPWRIMGVSVTKAT